MSNRITYDGFDISALVTAKWNYMFVDGTPRSYFGRFSNIADHGLLDADESDEQESGADDGRRRTVCTRRRASTPTARTGAFATSRRATRWIARLAQRARRCSSLRLYGTAQDPYIHTDYIGIDPEVGGAVPTLRTLLLGTNIVW